MAESYDTFRWYDYVIFAGTLLISLSIGVYYALSGGKQKTTKEFHLADRKMGILSTALSLVLSNVSALLIMGSTAELYEHGITTWFTCVGMALWMPIGTVLFVPIFYGLGFTSTFTYLEKRLHSRFLRQLGSAMMIISTLLYMGLSMYAPAIALEAVTGIPFVASVLITGAVVVLYSSIGGLKAVIGTDTFQAIVMFGGCLTVLILGSIRLGGINKVWEIAAEGGRLDLDFTPTPLVRNSVWSAMIGQGFQGFYYPTSQTNVQRALATSSVTSAKIMMLLWIPLYTTIYCIVYLCGMVVYAYYTQLGCDPLKTGQITSSNQLLPFYIMDGLSIPGIPGLFTAALFCGALSSVSSSLNSLSAITWKDFLEGRFTQLTEFQKTTFNKGLVLFYGIIGIGFSFLFAFAQGNVLQMSNTVIGAFAGPGIGILMVGMLFPWVEWKGTLVGLIVGFALAVSMSLGSALNYPWGATMATSTDKCMELGLNVTHPGDGENIDAFPLFMISFQWYHIISITTTVVIGLLVSLAFWPQRASEQDARLVVPVCDRLCGCLPARCLDDLHCSIPYSDIEVDNIGRYDMTGLLEDDTINEKETESGQKNQAFYDELNTYL